MKSLEELIEEIKREARGGPPPEEGSRDHVDPPRFEIPPLESPRFEIPPMESPLEPTRADVPVDVTEPLIDDDPIPEEEVLAWFVVETEKLPEPLPMPEPEPPIVDPLPPLPDEPEPVDDEEEDEVLAIEAPPDVSAPVREADFDLDLDVDVEFDRLLDLVGEREPAGTSSRPGASTEPEPLREPVPDSRLRPGLVGRLRFVVPLIVVLGLVAGLLVLSGPDRDPGGRVTGPPVGSPADQDVVAWSVWDGQTSEGAFVSVVAVGGGNPPVALGVPSYTMANIPGYGTGTVGDAIAAEGRDRGAAAVENILGVGVDASAFSTLEQLAGIIDELGGISVSETTMSGDAAVQYLMRGGDGLISAEFQFLRWQELVAGMLDAVNGRTEVFGQLGPEVGPVLATAGSAGTEVLELPVIDIGSGLARPDAEAVERIVREWFVPTARTTRTVRLSVLNGVGTPGVGDRVSNVLVPAGFRLVASGNAETFDERETRIIATSEEFLPEAEIARDLLGVGKVYVGVQPSGLVDVTVIVGADFGGP